MNPKLDAASALLREGRKAEAADLMMATLATEPGASASVYAILLNLLLELGRHDDGLFWSEQALAHSTKDYALLNLRGAFLRLTGHRAEASATFDRAIKLRPGEIAARANKGHLYNDAKDGKAAEAIFSALVRQHPRIAELQRALGVALVNQQKIEAAERRFRQALALDPANIDAWLDLSAAAMRRQDLSAALSTLDEAIARNTPHPRLVRAKVALFFNAGQREQATRFLRPLAPIHGHTAWFCHDLARSLMNSAPDEATMLHRRAIEAAPQNREFRLSFAEHLLRNASGPEGSHIDNAHLVLKSLPPSREPKPAELRIRAQISARAVDLAATKSIGSFEDLGRLWAEAGFHTALLDHLARVERPADRRELIHQHRLWGDKAIARAQGNPIRRPINRTPSSKIRIGFMSSDLRNHPVAYFSWPLFEYVNRDRFEIYCYSFYRGEEPDALQRRLSSMVDKFRWEPGMTDHDAAQMIANDELDILFELGASTFMNKLEVMAWKPAPICASWLGYPHSAGLGTIDYLLVDPFINPPDPDLLIETPLVMPQSWITMSRQAFPDHYTIEPVPPCRRNGLITFGTANNTYKYNAAMLRAWAEVMKQVPNSRFIFLRPEVGAHIVRDNILAAFAEHGVAPDRIEFRAIRGKHMPHYNDIDIALDSFPQTGGTTTCEALWMGVPTVTMVGEAVFERLSYSILSNAGLGDLCAKTSEDFIRIAVALANDPDRIEALRNGLRDQLHASPLGRNEQFASDFYDLIARTVESRRREHAGSDPAL